MSKDIRRCFTCDYMEPENWEYQDRTITYINGKRTWRDADLYTGTYYICKRYPDPKKKDKDDWCGEWKKKGE